MREATHAVLTSLQLLDRMDAAIIVENAMKNADAVVQDEEFEYATPPEIFLSYQWGHQNEVRLLRQHLEMAGFSCWMDVGQMGGGDKLFEKIDTGIRGAKIIVCCVSTKYAKSPNCNREVNLSVNLGKPIIPLQMEKMNWPPPGSMGPIFSEYLFIRFFQRQGEETEKSDMRYWPLSKFQELLMQLSVNRIKPDVTVVQPEYKNWWVPKVEEVTVDKDRAKKQKDPSPDEIKKAADSPDIFISYQWGKQPQIIKLYKKLTSLSYTCWLDIMQMGGGDSLYDKIDRGLRGCRVVLSCVTSKYALSANCRREVSLADNLKKPLIPLLLESMTWPPPGPMAPILTQLLFINCSRDGVEESWEGPKFDEIIAMISNHVPTSPTLTGASTEAASPKSGVADEKKVPKKVDDKAEKEVTQKNAAGKSNMNEKAPPATVKKSQGKAEPGKVPVRKPSSDATPAQSQNKKEEPEKVPVRKPSSDATPAQNKKAEPEKVSIHKPTSAQNKKKTEKPESEGTTESHMRENENKAPSTAEESAPKSDNGQSTDSKQSKSCAVL